MCKLFTAKFGLLYQIISGSAYSTALNCKKMLTKYHNFDKILKLGGTCAHFPLLISVKFGMLERADDVLFYAKY